ncbi:hypothetical protein FA15DRAFT_674090 [Coprinopsis marcescibilis]|uniref:F-box domain-containing protein n=1 Tax=Coprinopsis marcescibilis TaxID=230819 RepID=A0A5C3KI74_COPMA|nr:hypothetical protein FA15DRAFT_674090 [Coprinopsis marcescibilis]
MPPGPYFMKLPTEIHLEILDSITNLTACGENTVNRPHTAQYKSTLLSMSVVCKSLRQMVIPHLFETLVFHTQREFFGAVIAGIGTSRKLAQHARRCISQTKISTRHVLNILFSALGYMKDLQMLDIVGIDYFLAPDIIRSIGGVTSLKVLRIESWNLYRCTQEDFKAISKLRLCELHLYGTYHLSKLQLAGFIDFTEMKVLVSNMRFPVGTVASPATGDLPLERLEIVFTSRDTLEPSFFDRLSNITWLKLLATDVPPRNLTLQAHHLPRLTHLECTPNLFHAIYPGRPVENLKIVRYLGDLQYAEELSMILKRLSASQRKVPLKKLAFAMPVIASAFMTRERLPDTLDLHISTQDFATLFDFFVTQIGQNTSMHQVLQSLNSHYSNIPKTVSFDFGAAPYPICSLLDISSQYLEIGKLVEVSPDMQRIDMVGVVWRNRRGSRWEVEVVEESLREALIKYQSLDEPSKVSTDYNGYFETRVLTLQSQLAS